MRNKTPRQLGRARGVCCNQVRVLGFRLPSLSFAWTGDVGAGKLEIVASSGFEGGRIILQ